VLAVFNVLKFEFSVPRIVQRLSIFIKTITDDLVGVIINNFRVKIKIVILNCVEFYLIICHLLLINLYNRGIVECFLLLVGHNKVVDQVFLVD
jgi:hypothetical protein